MASVFHAPVATVECEKTLLHQLPCAVVSAIASFTGPTKGPTPTARLIRDAVQLLREDGHDVMDDEIIFLRLGSLFTNGDPSISLVAKTNACWQVSLLAVHKRFAPRSQIYSVTKRDP